MRLSDVLHKDGPTISLEFFPPKKPDGQDKLLQVVAELSDLGPDFVSITYGAGGSTREPTYDMVRRMVTETAMTTVAHLTCVCDSLEEVETILEQYAGLAVPGIMALAGDPPRDDEGGCYDIFNHAVDLVRFIGDFNQRKKHPEWAGFEVGVAGFPEGHPATPNRRMEIEYLKQKCEAGAEYICTQLFFDNHDFYDFRERCEIAGISIPILAGLMPIISRTNFERIPDLALGAHYPASLIRRVEEADEEDIWKIGVEWTTEQSLDLLRNDVRGIHFYTLNRSRSTRLIWEAIREAL